MQHANYEDFPPVHKLKDANILFSNLYKAGVASNALLYYSTPREIRRNFIYSEKPYRTQYAVYTRRVNLWISLFRIKTVTVWNRRTHN